MMNKHRGFTLIELLVVIAIIGLLSSVVLASLNTARDKGNDAQRVSNLRSVQTALELYATDHNGSYPVTGGQWYSNTCSGWTPTTIPGLVSGGYIPQLPVDPQQNAAANTCCYLYNSDGTDYDYILYNCYTSKACYGNAINSAYYWWAAPTNACSVNSGSAAIQAKGF